MCEYGKAGKEMNLIVNNVDYGPVKRTKQDRGKAWVFEMENQLQVRASFSIIKSFSSSGVYELITRDVDEEPETEAFDMGKVVLKEGERIVQIIAGLTGEYEVIVTDAPKEVIEEYLIASNRRMKSGVSSCDYYLEIENKGYHVEQLGTQEEIEDVGDCEVFDRYLYDDDGE